MTPDGREVVEIVARELARAKNALLASDKYWAAEVAHFKDMVAQYGEDYANGRSRITDAFREAQIALTAIEASGRRIVPVEPTEAMWVAGTKSLRLYLTSADGIYGAMLSASPKVTDCAALSQTDTAEERE